jgi:hypothetical protein
MIMSGNISSGQPATGNNMGKPLMLFAGVCVVASAMVTMEIERRWALEENGMSADLQKQATQLAEASAKSARLSNVVTKMAAPSSLTPEQFRELIRLRNEVGQLHKLSEEASALEATNVVLRDRAMSEQTLAAAKALPNYWPKTQLAFAGFADPESAVKSLLTAMRDNDLKALTNCFDPAAGPNLAAAMERGDVDHATKEAMITGAMSEFLAGCEGFHVDNDSMTGPGEATITLSMDGEGRMQTFVLRKFGDEWKLANGF